MTRSGYSDDCEYLELYRGAVRSALRGKRGQAFLREMITAMDAMPVKELAHGTLIPAPDRPEKCCAMGAVIRSRDEIDRAVNAKIDPGEPHEVARFLGIADSMAAEIASINDDGGPPGETPSERWARVRRWAERQLVATKCPRCRGTGVARPDDPRGDDACRKCGGKGLVSAEDAEYG